MQTGGRVDYEDLLNQKRRDEARYRHGGYQPNLRSANSEGYLNSYGNSGGFNEQLEDLSQAVSRTELSKERRGEMLMLMLMLVSPCSSPDCRAPWLQTTQMWPSHSPTRAQPSQASSLSPAGPGRLQSKILSRILSGGLGRPTTSRATSPASPLGTRGAG